MPETQRDLPSPLELELVDDRFVGQPAEGMGLCLSGGGYRAMVFHLGALWRLYEADMLKSLQRVSSVSGGSITAAALGLAWPKLSFAPAKLRDDFVPKVVDPIREMARQSIDTRSVLGGVLLPGTAGERIASSYREHLFGDATLQDLPDSPPRFVINATNVQSGALWRFSKPYMWDWRVGKVENPEVSLAVAVAASSAFPPVLSPVVIPLGHGSFVAETGDDLQHEPFTTEAVLSDGGVYDNLGLETVYKRLKTVLVSDAGGKLPPQGNPKRDWLRHAYRTLHVIDNQVRNLRKRQLIAAYKSQRRTGTYWGIRTNIADYELPDPLPCPHDRTTKLAETRTRLKRMPEELQERLINWGYAVCDAALRRHVDTNLPRGQFPYPARGV